MTTLVEHLPVGDELIHKSCIYCRSEVLILVQGKQITWISRGACRCPATVVEFQIKPVGLE